MMLGVILLVKFVQNLTESHLTYQFKLFGYNICNSLSLCIFSKALKYPTQCSKQYQLSDFISYSQVDAQRLAPIAVSCTAVVFFPIQLGVGVFMMYRFIGVSFLAGVGVIILMSLLILCVSWLSVNATTQLLIAKDKRMKTTTEIFNMIRFIKANAWEKYFLTKVTKDRDE
jgi:ABC-type bacteriocin/lantibiotic exporter with double-glycine peptidase domain